MIWEKNVLLMLHGIPHQNAPSKFSPGIMKVFGKYLIDFITDVFIGSEDRNVECVNATVT